MPEPKLPKLVERLLALTNDDKIGWEETADESTFQAAVGEYVVQVARRRNAENWDTWDYSIQVADRLGRLLDEATTATLLSKTVDAGMLIDRLAQAVMVDHLGQLWNGARRKALKADEALSDLLSSLNSM